MEAIRMEKRIWPKEQQNSYYLLGRSTKNRLQCRMCFLNEILFEFRNQKAVNEIMSKIVIRWLLLKLFRHTYLWIHFQFWCWWGAELRTSVIAPYISITSVLVEKGRFYFRIGLVYLNLTYHYVSNMRYWGRWSTNHWMRKIRACQCSVSPFFTPE